MKKATESKWTIEREMYQNRVVQSHASTEFFGESPNKVRFSNWTNECLIIMPAAISLFDSSKITLTIKSHNRDFWVRKWHNNTFSWRERRSHIILSSNSKWWLAKLVYVEEYQISAYISFNCNLRSHSAQQYKGTVW